MVPICPYCKQVCELAPTNDPSAEIHIYRCRNYYRLIDGEQYGCCRYNIFSKAVNELGLK